VKQVGAERAIAHRVLDGRVGRRNNPRPNVGGGRRAESGHPFFLDDAKNRALRVRTERGHRIKVDRPSSSGLETSGACDGRVREGAALVPEQLGLDECRGQARAIDHEKRLFPARAGQVHQAGEGVFPDAGLADEEDIRLRERVAAGFVENGAHRLAARDDRGTTTHHANVAKRISRLTSH
jgi:hypothetical protein